MYPDNCEFCSTTYSRGHSAYNTWPWRKKYEYGILFFKKKYEICDYCVKYLKNNLDFEDVLGCKSDYDRRYQSTNSSKGIDSGCEMTSMAILDKTQSNIIKKFYENKDDYSQKVRDYISSKTQGDKARADNRKNNLVSRFGEDAALKILDERIWIDMTKDMLIESWGNPEDETVNVFKNKTKEKYFYNGRTTRQGTTVYQCEVKLEDDVVVGYKENE